MKSIIYVGMDVHTTNYTLSCYTVENDQDFATIQMEPDYRNVLKYLDKVQENYGSPCEFHCGYEAGCLGFSLYHQLTEHNVKCVILAPSTMPSCKGEIKTDKRDAMKIAHCLAYNTYSAVHIPTKEDSDVKEYIRMHDIVETGDFNRFPKAEQYAAFLGLVPGEHSSSDSRNQLGITKAGNSHLRRLLTEAAQCYGRGQVGYKSKQLKARQAGNLPEVISYADKANERLRRKFYTMVLKNNKKHNVAVAAIARELACFVWGMMTCKIA